LLLSPKKDHDPMDYSATGFLVMNGKEFICYTSNSVKTDGSFDDKMSG